MEMEMEMEMRRRLGFGLAATFGSFRAAKLEPGWMAIQCRVEVT